MWSLFRRKPRRTKPVRRTPPSARPRLEALEDRCCPSSFSVTPPRHSWRRWRRVRILQHLQPYRRQDAMSKELGSLPQTVDQLFAELAADALADEPTLAPLA
jgi:hypothetical protein